ncbi:hypothetical protein [Limosilactobacillus fastidiosus]|uniref:Uncharacterized protein n=2 Tax=Limosilactobacillus fastidiosus TaxID=2759855 RepID=A0A7W3TY20_9LACO|nr:hypothetical protein [Limosilactobacillus fastidiosus]MBB1063206.1 hypothetical protein [Limosilactobacillus fastidiosus]MBB1085378.1 hypothetical protein [Limosilactobacillus fastidiosus]MCD7083680.1 hypothetical protein [Limosilactobacillus fastidiosus]MCD7085360.1 hypothetical protein [Limosilactobacillus fastidiosus]MCD7114875.1 hypothetical protein [Limosilactobacillus fastidiosus]
MRNFLKRVYEHLANISSAKTRHEKKREREHNLLEKIHKMDDDDLAIRKSKLEGKTSSGSQLTPYLFGAFLAGITITLIGFSINVLYRALPIISGYRKVNAEQLGEVKYFLAASLGGSFILLVAIIILSIWYFRKQRNDKSLLDLYKQEFDRRDKDANR